MLENFKATAALILLTAGIVGNSDLFAAQIITLGEYSFGSGDEPSWVAKRSVPDTWDLDATGAAENGGWRYWLLDYQADRRKGKRERYFDYAYESLSSETTSDAAKVAIDFFPEFQRLTIHDVTLRRDGTWHSRFDPKKVTLARREANFEHDMTTGAVTALVVLEDVRPKDVVRVRYSIDGENPILGGLDDERILFASTSPILDRHMRVLFDADTKVDAMSLEPGSPCLALPARGYGQITPAHERLQCLGLGSTARLSAKFFACKKTGIASD